MYVNFLKRHVLFGLIFSLLSYTFSCLLFCQLVGNTIFKRSRVCGSIGKPYDRDEEQLSISDLLGKHCHVDYKACVFADNTSQGFHPVLPKAYLLARNFILKNQWLLTPSKEYTTKRNTRIYG